MFGRRALLLAGVLMSAPQALAGPVVAPASFDVANREPLLVAHAQGAQIYECKSGANGVSVWSFREPIAALFRAGVTIGRHYAGPTWELSDGGAVKGKALATAPGGSSTDVPLLKLEVTERRGAGSLSGAKLVLRLNTRGGVLSGPCSIAGELKAMAYSADYVFLA